MLQVSGFMLLLLRFLFLLLFFLRLFLCHIQDLPSAIHSAGGTRMMPNAGGTARRAF